MPGKDVLPDIHGGAFRECVKLGNLQASNSFNHSLQRTSGGIIRLHLQIEKRLLEIRINTDAPNHYLHCSGSDCHGPQATLADTRTRKEPPDTIEQDGAVRPLRPLYSGGGCERARRQALLLTGTS